MLERCGTLPLPQPFVSIPPRTTADGNTHTQTHIHIPSPLPDRGTVDEALTEGNVDFSELCEVFQEHGGESEREREREMGRHGWRERWATRE